MGNILVHGNRVNANWMRTGREWLRNRKKPTVSGYSKSQNCISIKIWFLSMLFITLIGAIQCYHWKYPQTARNSVWERERLFEQRKKEREGCMRRHFDFYPNGTAFISCRDSFSHSPRSGCALWIEAKHMNKTAKQRPNSVEIFMVNDIPNIQEAFRHASHRCRLISKWVFSFRKHWIPNDQIYLFIILFK